MAPTGGAAKPPNRGRGRGEAGGRGRSPGVVGRGCVRILLQSWFQIIFNLSWLTMWVSDHLVKRNIIHTASQHMYGEGTLLKGIVIKQMSDGILLLMLS